MTTTAIRIKEIEESKIFRVKVPRTELEERAWGNTMKEFENENPTKISSCKRELEDLQHDYDNLDCAYDDLENRYETLQEKYTELLEKYVDLQYDNKNMKNMLE